LPVHRRPGLRRARADAAAGHAQSGREGADRPERVDRHSITGKKGADGSTTVQFGGCDGKIPNCIPIVEGWNDTVRLYRPRAEILNGTFKFPEARPAT